MTPDHGELLYEGKAKRVFASTDPDRVLVEFKNDATAFNAQKKAQLDDKGRLNCQISARLFELLEREGVPTHYCGLAGETWMLVRRVEIIPLEVVLRNIATGSLCRQTPIAEGTAIEPALLDLYYKDDSLGDPLLTEARVQLLGVADTAQLSAIEQLARRVNAVLLPFFDELELQLAAGGDGERPRQRMQRLATVLDDRYSLQQLQPEAEPDPLLRSPRDPGGHADVRPSAVAPSP